MLCKDMRARIKKQLIGALILLGAVAASPGASASAESAAITLGVGQERPDRVFLRRRHLRRRSGHGGDDRDRHQPRVRGESDLRSRRQKDRVHTRRSTNPGRRSSSSFDPTVRRSVSFFPRDGSTGGSGASGGHQTAKHSSCSSTADRSCIRHVSMGSFRSSIPSAEVRNPSSPHPCHGRSAAITGATTK